MTGPGWDKPGGQWGRPVLCRGHKWEHWSCGTGDGLVLSGPGCPQARGGGGEDPEAVRVGAGVTDRTRAGRRCCACVGVAGEVASSALTFPHGAVGRWSLSSDDCRPGPAIQWHMGPAPPAHRPPCPWTLALSEPHSRSPAAVAMPGTPRSTACPELVPASGGWRLHAPVSCSPPGCLGGPCPSCWYRWCGGPADLAVGKRPSLVCQADGWASVLLSL